MRAPIHRCAIMAAAIQASDMGSVPAASGEHGLPQQAVEIARPRGFPISNSMVVTWIVAVILIVFTRFATRNLRSVPAGAQNFLEWLIESLYGFLEGVIG